MVQSFFEKKPGVAQNHRGYYTTYNLVTGWEKNVYDPADLYVSTMRKYKNTKSLSKAISKVFESRIEGLSLGKGVGNGASNLSQQGYPGDQRTGVITGNILQGTRIKSSMLNDYGGNPQFVCETRTICEAESSEEQERIQKVEDNLAQLRRAVKVSRAWQQKHDETTESLKVNQETLSKETQQQSTLLFFAVTIAFLAVVFALYQLTHYVFPDFRYKTILCCSSSLTNAAQKAPLAPRRAKKEPHKSL